MRLIVIFYPTCFLQSLVAYTLFDKTILNFLKKKYKYIIRFITAREIMLRAPFPLTTDTGAGVSGPL